jgi:hypothetical protein
MKTITLLFIFIVHCVTANSQETSTLRDSILKSTLDEAKKRAFDKLLEESFKGLDKKIDERSKKKEEEKLNQKNANRCPDTLGCKLDSIAQIIIAQAKKNGVKRIAVWHFTDTTKYLGGSMADKLSMALAGIDSTIEIIDRNYIAVLMKEHQLNEDSLINPETAKRMGLIMHADAIITGSLRFGDNTTYIYSKMIDTETGKLIWGKPLIVPVYLPPAQKSTTKATNNQSTLTHFYDYPPGYKYVSGASSDYCLAQQTGCLTIKNTTGKNIMISYDKDGRVYEKYAIIPAGQTQDLQLHQGLYHIYITITGVNQKIDKGELIVRTCEKLILEVQLP